MTAANRTSEGTDRLIGRFRQHGTAVRGDLPSILRRSDAAEDMRYFGARGKRETPVATRNQPEPTYSRSPPDS